MQVSQAAGWFGIGVAVHAMAALLIYGSMRAWDWIKGRPSPAEGLRRETERFRAVMDEDGKMRARLQDILATRERGAG